MFRQHSNDLRFRDLLDSKIQYKNRFASFFQETTPNNNNNNNNNKWTEGVTRINGRSVTV